MGDIKQLEGDRLGHGKGGRFNCLEARRVADARGSKVRCPLTPLFPSGSREDPQAFILEALWISNEVSSGRRFKWVGYAHEWIVDRYHKDIASIFEIRAIDVSGNVGGGA